MGGNELLVILRAKDELTGALKKAGAEVGKSKDQLGGFGNVLATAGKTALVAGAAIGGALATGVTVATSKAMKFETLMGNISTLIGGDSTEAISKLKDGILGLSSAFPQSPEELGAEAYNILSAGFSDTNQALQVLQYSAMLATGGLGSLAGSTDIMTSALNAFKGQGLSAQQTSDILFKTVKYGKTTVEEMAQAFGATAPIVASAGVSLEEFSAATAALTTGGLPASQAQNQLRQATVSLVKPTEDMNKLLQKAGFESGAAALKNIGLVDTMKAVEAAAGGDSEMLAKAWGSVEALGAATSLTGSTNEAFTTTLKDMTSGAGALNEAFIKQKQTVANQWQIIKNQLNTALIELGYKVLPIVSKALEWLGGFWQENQAAIMGFVNNGLKQLGVVAQIVFKGMQDAFIFLQPYLMQIYEYFQTNLPIALNALKQAWDFLWPSVQKFWEALVNLWNSLQPLLPVLEFIGKVAFVVIVIALKIIIEVATILINVITWLWQNVLLPFGEWLIGILVPIFNTVWGFIKDYIIPIIQDWIFIFQKVIGFLQTVFAPYLAVFKAMWQVTWEAIKLVFGIIWETIVAVVKVAWTLISNAFMIGMDIIKGIMRVGAQLLKGDFSGAMETIMNTAKSIMDRVKNVFKGAIDAIVGFFGGIGDRIGKALSNLGSIVKNAVSGAIKSIPGVGGDIANALGFAHGGSFVVGGVGGTDSQMVSFKATPGERVTVETPQQQQNSDNRNYSKSVSIGQVIVNNNQDYEVFMNKLALLV